MVASGCARLTPRQRAVAAQLLDGRSAPQIAGELTLATSTVRMHVRALYTKVEVHALAAFLHWAREHERCCIRGA